MKTKLIRVATVPISLDKLLEGQLRYLNQFYNLIGVSGEDELLRKVEKREKIQVYPIKMQRSISPIDDVVSLFKLYKYFKKEKPQIVHSITPKAGLLSMVAAYFANVPIRIHTFTGLLFPTRKGFMQKLLISMDRLLCKCATNVYPEGGGVKRDLITYKITSKPLKVSANGNINGIDTTFFNPQLFTQIHNEDLRKKLNIQHKDFVFVFVGRLVKDKGINELVAAFENLQVKFPSREGLGVCKNDEVNPTNIKLILVGPLETDLDPLSSKTLDAIKTNSNIISVGWQEDVRPYFIISNVLVFPSYREGFPNVVLQAGAMGLPSIVTNINGCNEIIKEGKNGWIIPVKNQEELEKAMGNCLVKKDDFNLAKSNARKMIENRYEQKIVWEAILEEYKKLEEHTP
jgi:glycosyltransferase involved in cell wall biosynthesis